jgi:hypothetical protein
VNGQRIGYIRVNTLDRNPERQLEQVQAEASSWPKYGDSLPNPPSFQRKLEPSWYSVGRGAIGVGTAHWFVPPLPPNRAGGSPAHGSPLGGLTSGGLEEA